MQPLNWHIVVFNLSKDKVMNRWMHELVECVLSPIECVLLQIECILSQVLSYAQFGKTREFVECILSHII